MRQRLRTWLVAVGALTLALWQVQAAHAAPQLRDQGRHCVAELPVTDSHHDAESAKVTCYPTFAEAVHVATGGRLSLHPDATTVTDHQLLAAGVVSSADHRVSRPLLGIEYRHVGYDGESLVLYGSGGNGCYGGTWYGFPNLADVNFDNRISSAKMYSNCLGKHYDGASYDGSYVYCDSRCSSMGSMNDRTSSIKFF